MFCTWMLILMQKFYTLLVQSIQEENCAEGMYVGNGEKYVNSVISLISPYHKTVAIGRIISWKWETILWRNLFKTDYMKDQYRNILKWTEVTKIWNAVSQGWV